MTYDLAGNLKTIVHPDSTVVTYDYDKLNNLVSKSYNMALDIHNVQPQALYSSEVVQEYFKWFNKSDYEYWR